MAERERLSPTRLPPGPPELLVRKARPENLEFPMAHLNGWLTPNRLFYRRNHFEYPAVDPGSWRLTISGAVNRPLSLSLADLQVMPRTSQWTTLECSGNKRGLFSRKTEGDQWTSGAIGNAEWAGLPLDKLVRQARVRPDAVEVLFTGADQGVFKETGERVHFARSLPLAAAFDPAVLLALEMNGEPLPEKHGGPLRLIVPRWYGMASVKWLTRIEVLPRPFTGPFQRIDYVYLAEPAGRAVPVTTWKVNSAIAQPWDGARRRPGPLLVRGAAWGGVPPLQRVEVSVDGGRWAPARQVGPAGTATWRLWQYRTPPLEPGEHVILARATDGAGETQPLEAPWNVKGYGNNSAARVRVRID